MYRYEKEIYFQLVDIDRSKLAVKAPHPRSTASGQSFTPSEPSDFIWVNKYIFGETGNTTSGWYLNHVLVLPCGAPIFRSRYFTYLTKRSRDNFLFLLHVHATSTLDGIRTKPNFSRSPEILFLPFTYLSGTAIHFGTALRMIVVPVRNITFN